MSDRTITGRMSASEPALQGIPIPGAYDRRLRGAFLDLACECRLDFKSFELRLPAHREFGNNLTPRSS